MHNLGDILHYLEGSIHSRQSWPPLDNPSTIGASSKEEGPDFRNPWSTPCLLRIWENWHSLRVLCWFAPICRVQGQARLAEKTHLWPPQWLQQLVLHTGNQLLTFHCLWNNGLDLEHMRLHKAWALITQEAGERVRQSCFSPFVELSWAIGSRALADLCTITQRKEFMDFKHGLLNLDHHLMTSHKLICVYMFVLVANPLKGSFGHLPPLALCSGHHAEHNVVCLTTPDNPAYLHTWHMISLLENLVFGSRQHEMLNKQKLKAFLVFHHNSLGMFTKKTIHV